MIRRCIYYNNLDVINTSNRFQIQINDNKINNLKLAHPMQ